MFHAVARLHLDVKAKVKYGYRFRRSELVYVDETIERNVMLIEIYFSPSLEIEFNTSYISLAYGFY